MKTFYLFFILALFAGCTAEKHVTSEQSKSTIKENESETAAYFMDSQKHSDVNSTRQSRITETLDTCLKVPGSQVSSEKIFDNLRAGDSLISESEVVKGVVTFDPATGRLHLSVTDKPRIIPLQAKKVSEINETNNQATVENINSLASSNKISTSETQMRSDQTMRDVKRTSFPWWILLVCVATGIAVFVFIKYIKPRIL